MDTVLESITLTIDRDAIRSALRISPEGREAGRVESMTREAEAAGRPAAVYRAARIDRVRADGADIEGIAFDGDLIAENLAGQAHAFPFIATGGPEIEAWANSYTEMLERFRADAIATFALASAVDSLKSHILDRHNGGPLSMMNPGSLDGWRIAEQKKLFALFGASAERIGVSLTDSMLMRPLKSLSGILFFSSEGFINCSRCPRARCPARMAPFNGVESGAVGGCGHGAAATAVPRAAGLRPSCTPP
ncbi:MAG TPA: hypothetical protein VLM75_02375 [Spirochaetota bacterium]|nr:hypothetical protein [Spirochaetota bacterium]